MYGFDGGFVRCSPVVRTCPYGARSLFAHDSGLYSYGARPMSIRYSYVVRSLLARCSVTPNTHPNNETRPSDLLDASRENQKMNMVIPDATIADDNTIAEKYIAETVNDLAHVAAISALGAAAENSVIADAVADSSCTVSHSAPAIYSALQTSSSRARHVPMISWVVSDCGIYI